MRYTHFTAKLRQTYLSGIQCAECFQNVAIWLKQMATFWKNSVHLIHDKYVGIRFPASNVIKLSVVHRWAECTHSDMNDALRNKCRNVFLPLITTIYASLIALAFDISRRMDDRWHSTLADDLKIYYLANGVSLRNRIVILKFHPCRVKWICFISL